MKTSLISQFLFENASSLSLILSTGQSVRLSMKLFLDDFLVQNLMSQCKEVLPEETFLAFYQDLLTYFLLTFPGQGEAADQLDKFRLFMTALIEG